MLLHGWVEWVELLKAVPQMALLRVALLRAVALVLSSGQRPPVQLHLQAHVQPESVQPESVQPESVQPESMNASGHPLRWQWVLGGGQ